MTRDWIGSASLFRQVVSSALAGILSSFGFCVAIGDPTAGVSNGAATALAAAVQTPLPASLLKRDPAEFLSPTTIHSPLKP